MDEYRVEIKRSAIRELRDLENKAAKRIVGSIQALALSPRPSNCRKLAGSVNSYRVRVGVYRVIY